MSKEKMLIVDFLSKVLKKDENEVKSLIYAEDGETVVETAVENILNADADRIKKLQKEYETNGFNSGHKKAVAETMSEFEERVRSKYGASSSAKGIDLIDEVIVKNQKTAVNTEDVRKHPTYLELEAQTVKKDEYNRVLSDFENFKTKLERDKVMDKVKSKALDILGKLNPVIEDNATIANKRKQIFLNEFENYDYEFDGDYTMVVKDGVRIQDKHGHAIGFETYVRDVAERNFVLEAQQSRQSAGNSNGGGSFNVTIPRTPEEYHKAITSEPDMAKRVAIKKAYESANK